MNRTARRVVATSSVRLKPRKLSSAGEAVFAAAVPLALLTARRRTPTGQAAAFIAVTLALTIVGFAVIDLSLTALVAPLLRIMHSVSGGGGE